MIRRKWAVVVCLMLAGSGVAPAAPGDAGDGGSARSSEHGSPEVQGVPGSVALVGEQDDPQVFVDHLQDVSAGAFPKPGDIDAFLDEARSVSGTVPADLMPASPPPPWSKATSASTSASSPDGLSDCLSHAPAISASPLDNGPP